MRSDTIIGWDVGGAHVKAARIDSEGRVSDVVQLPCPLWEGLSHLHASLQLIYQRWQGAHVNAVTMTGEMADLFADRATGVAQITHVLQERLPEHTLRLYAGTHGFVAAARAREFAASIASANWLASAQYVASRAPDALLVDVGSTTTDICLIEGGQPSPIGTQDAARLAHGELLYTGVVRTPVYALAQRAPFDGDWIPLMTELFATSADVYRLTGQLANDIDQQPTPDRGDKSLASSARRLARMLGRDYSAEELPKWKALARWIAETQQRQIADGCARVLSRASHHGAELVGAGVGRFLVKTIAERLGRGYRDFHELVDARFPAREWISHCASAVAAALLAKRLL